MQVRQGRINFTNLVDLPGGAPVMTGIFSTDLILLALENIDVILGMEWMTRHGAILDISS